MVRIAVDMPQLRQVPDRPTEPSQRITTIEPRSGLRLLPWRDLRDRRELLGFLVWRDLKIRYAQTALGAAWAVLQPLLAMAIFTIVFGRLARVGSDGVPYSVFAYAGLVPWLYFSNSVTTAAASLVDNERILTKVYLPRVLLPAAPCVAALVDLSVMTVLLGAMATFHGLLDPTRLVLLPAIVLLGLAAVIGLSAGLSALNVRFRDVRYVVPFIVQVGMFASPVVYSSTLVPARFEGVLGLNPMVTVIGGFRWVFLGTPAPATATVVASILATVIAVIGGLALFHRQEPAFADLL